MDQIKTNIPPPVPCRRKKRKPPPPIPKFTETINKTCETTAALKSQTSFNEKIPQSLESKKHSILKSNHNQVIFKKGFEVDDGIIIGRNLLEKNINKNNSDLKLLNHMEVISSSEKQTRTKKLKKYPPLLFTAQDFEDVIISSQVNDKKTLTFAEDTNRSRSLENAHLNFLTDKYKGFTSQSRALDFPPAEKTLPLKNSSNFTKTLDNKDIFDKNHSSKSPTDYPSSSSSSSIQKNVTPIDPLQEKQVTFHKYSAKSSQKRTIISDLKEKDNDDDVKAIGNLSGNKKTVLNELLDNFEMIKLRAVPTKSLIDSEERRMEDTRLEYLMIKDREKEMTADNIKNKNVSLNNNSAYNDLLGKKTDVSEDLTTDINNITSLKCVEGTTPTKTLPELKELAIPKYITTSIQPTEDHVPAGTINNNHSEDNINKNDNINVHNNTSNNDKINNDKDNNYTIFNQTSYAISTTSIGSIFVNPKVKPIADDKLNGKFDYLNCSRTNRSIEKNNIEFEISSTQDTTDDLNEKKTTRWKSEYSGMRNELEVNCKLANKLHKGNKALHNKKKVLPPPVNKRTTEKQGTTNFSKSTELYSSTPVFVLRM